MMTPHYISKKEADRLISNHYEFAKKSARVFASRNRDCDSDDLESEALFALVECAKTFNPEMGAFSTHARYRIQGRLTDYARKQRKRLDLSCDHDPDLEEDNRDCISELVRSAENDLATEEWDFVKRRLSGRTFAEMAEEDGVNSSTVYRRQQKILRERRGE